ncbi:hypothetical protein EDC04DRAFT_2897568 [Pisolithus marmoratus]|nr:hypothetical protein EDC04DRAFT_2897568 [Pisolithus marmoratus]
MPPSSKVWHTSDKEDFVGNCDMEVPSGWPHCPSEKQKQLEYEQQEFAQCQDAKACKQIHCQQLAEEGSEDDIGEEDEVDCQSDSDGKDMQFINQVTLNTKVPSIDLETCGETITTDDELFKELCWSSQTPSNHQLSKHKRSNDKSMDGRTPELEETVDYVASNCQSGKHKWSKQICIDHRTPKLEDTMYITYL